jgi:hypothetical protein
MQNNNLQKVQHKTAVSDFLSDFHKKMDSKSDMNFEEIWERIKLLTGWKKYGELADFLEIKQPSVAGAKKKGTIPLEWVVRVAAGFKGSTDWLFFGNGPMRPGEAAPAQQQQPPQQQPLPAEGVDQSPYAVFDSLGVVEGMGMLTSIYGSGYTILI